jgi:uracil-DNA glycosylase
MAGALWLNIEDFCKEVRECRDCVVLEERTPFVYGGRVGDTSYEPKVLVVSQVPPPSAWKEDIGKHWAEGDLFATTKKVKVGAPHTLCFDWLEKDENWAKDHLFWIQRTNCAAIRERLASKHCSDKFLNRAMELVKPRLILILGRCAAEYFFHFRKLSDIMGQVRKYQERHDCIVLYHPSPAAGNWHKQREHEESLQLARQRINDL